MSPRILGALVALALPFAVACSGSSGNVGDADPFAEPDPGSASDAAPSSNVDGGADATDTDGGAAGPHITVAVRGEQTPVAHGDGWSGQTPTKQIVAIRSLTLLRSPSDANPVRVFDLGASTVEVDLATGAKVDIARVPATSVTSGSFVIAKVGVAYVRYSVAARMHAGVAIDGRYDNVQALSNGAVIDGVPRSKGYYRYAFGANGQTFGALEGEGAPLPAVTSGVGLSLDASGTQAFYVFPIALPIRQPLTSDTEVVVDVNVHESFRWQDQTLPGYAAGVFDTTPATFEPVMSFGANSLGLKIGPSI